MTRKIFFTDHQEQLEYHGNTSIERICRQNGAIIRKDWILFDTVEEAQEFFNDNF